VKRQTTLLTAVLALALGAVAFVSRNGAHLDSEIQRRVDALLARAGTTADATTIRDDRADLPAPVWRYLATALPDDQADVETVRIEQRGAFRLGDVGSWWRPLTATQHVTTDPPGFVWDASIAVAPFMPARVVDAYEDGRGSLAAKVLSTVSVADADRSAELDRGELVRYLAEAVWYPSALLPQNGVTWEPVHDRAARATIEDSGTTASLTFYFGSDDLVTRVVGERPRLQDDGSYEATRWTGHWDDYEEQSGIVVPTSGEVAWDLADRTLTYWRANVETIEYGVTTAAETDHPEGAHT
jgi:hypothetical protein